MHNDAAASIIIYRTPFSYAMHTLMNTVVCIRVCIKLYVNMYIQLTHSLFMFWGVDITLIVPFSSIHRSDSHTHTHTHTHTRQLIDIKNSVVRSNRVIAILLSPSLVEGYSTR